jgi:hypothetical protein
MRGQAKHPAMKSVPPSFASQLREVVEAEESRISAIQGQDRNAE